MTKKTLVRELTEAGCLVEPDAISSLDEDDVERILQLSPKPMMVNETFLENLQDSGASERSEIVDVRESRRTRVEVEKCFEGHKEEKGVDDFVQYYNDRYQRLSSMLSNRMELTNTVSIANLDDFSEKDEVSLIGMVRDKYKTGSGKWIIYLEDTSGETKALVDEDAGEWIVPDEVIGVAGVKGDDIVFVNEIVRPDIPISRDVSSTDEEVYAAFISDMHHGSIDFLEDRMDEFIEWLRSDDEKARKVSYLFINGDMVEGIGNYPGQREELRDGAENIYKQYREFERFVKKIPDDIQIIVAPGNHDFVRLAEPQPPVPEELFEEIYDKENIHWVSNPAAVRIHGFDNGGIRVLLYHGYSFDNHVDEIQELREKGYEEPHHAMIDYLQRRHLAPTFGNSPIAPHERDYMVIDEVPDIFVMGHTHAFDVANYKGVNVISSGTMQGQTEFQQRMGHKPDPGIVAMVNLKTRDTIVKEL
ncbi:MAG: DNA-directed DNA polymerase II small subunit [Candidatus Nanohaloarchaea archaeon]|nr:DNA-directed DNA polymerase II small subunit [Candidatus Nanohaloarchaea archaeon]